MKNVYLTFSTLWVLSIFSQSNFKRNLSFFPIYTLVKIMVLIIVMRLCKYIRAKPPLRVRTGRPVQQVHQPAQIHSNSIHSKIHVIDAETFLKLVLANLDSLEIFSYMLCPNETGNRIITLKIFI